MYADAGTAASESFWSVRFSFPDDCTGLSANTVAVPVETPGPDLPADAAATTIAASATASAAAKSFVRIKKFPPLLTVGRRTLDAFSPNHTLVSASQRDPVGVVALEQKLCGPPADAECVAERRKRDRRERRQCLAAAVVERARDGVAVADAAQL